MPSKRPEEAAMIHGLPVSEDPDLAELAPSTDIKDESVAPPSSARRMDKNARQYVFEGMEILLGALLSFVTRQMESRYGMRWEVRVDEHIVDEQLTDLYRNKNGERKIVWDQLALLKVIRWFWADAFETDLERHGIRRAEVYNLIQVRNALCHGQPFEYSDAEQALDSMRRLTEAVGAAAATAQLAVIRSEIPRRSGMDFIAFWFGVDTPNYPDGRTVLRLARANLCRTYGNKLRSIGIDPNRSGKPPNILDDGGSVWDILGFSAAGEGEFYENPHLTLGVGSEYVSAMATLSNKARSEYQSALRGIGENEFRRMVSSVLNEMRSVMLDCPGMEPRLRIRQRRWPKDSARSLMDAYIDVDLRTLEGDSSGVKHQPEWVGAAFDVLENENSNLEVQIGARFPYKTCEKISEIGSLEFVVRTWIACKPYIAALFGLEYIQGQPLNLPSPFD